MESCIQEMKSREGMVDSFQVILHEECNEKKKNESAHDSEEDDVDEQANAAYDREIFGSF